MARWMGAVGVTATEAWGRSKPSNTTQKAEGKLWSAHAQHASTRGVCRPRTACTLETTRRRAATVGAGSVYPAIVITAAHGFCEPGSSSRAGASSAQERATPPHQSQVQKGGAFAVLGCRVAHTFVFVLILALMSHTIKTMHTHDHATLLMHEFYALNTKGLAG
jgi:hypothetical protein